MRWIGDDDSLEPDYVSRVLDVFAEDERRVVVTTQIVYVDADGRRDPRHRLRPLGPGVGGPGRAVRRDAAAADDRLRAPRPPLRDDASRARRPARGRNMLREDEIFAARLALAGPWGHVPAPARAAATASRGHRRRTWRRLLGVPAWHRHARIAAAVPELSRLDRAVLARPRAAPASARRDPAVLRARQEDQGAPRCRQARAAGRSTGAPVPERGAGDRDGGRRDRRRGPARRASVARWAHRRPRRHPRPGRALRRRPPLLPGGVPRLHEVRRGRGGRAG